MGPSAAWFYEGQLRLHRNWNWNWNVKLGTLMDQDRGLLLIQFEALGPGKTPDYAGNILQVNLLNHLLSAGIKFNTASSAEDLGLCFALWIQVLTLCVL